MNKRFDAFQEIKAGRYQFSEKLGFGHFDNCYYESLDGRMFCMYFCANSVGRIMKLLPEGCFVPLDDQIEAWHTEIHGKDWRSDPVAFFDEYARVTDFCDEYCRSFGAISTSNQYRNKNGLIEYRAFSKGRYDNMVHNDLVSFKGKLVPIYFDRTFLENNQT